MPPVDLSGLTPAQQVRVAILCAWGVCDDPRWRRWAERWLDRSDRGLEKARSAWKALRAAQEWTAPRIAAEAARAAWRFSQAEWTARDRRRTASFAARAGAAVGRTVWWAQPVSATAGTPLDLPAIIARAVAEEPA